MSFVIRTHVLISVELHTEEEVRVSLGPVTGAFILLTRAGCLWPTIAMEINTPTRWL